MALAGTVETGSGVALALLLILSDFSSASRISLSQLLEEYGGVLAVEQCDSAVLGDPASADICMAIGILLLKYEVKTKTFATEDNK